MTREKIEDIRFIVIPFVANILKGINYEGQGDSDAKEFIDDFNVIFDLAIKALEQEPILDKIRAEIEQDAFTDVSGSKFIFVNRVNQIIDKYKAETENP